MGCVDAVVSACWLGDETTFNTVGLASGHQKHAMQVSCLPAGFCLT